MADWDVATGARPEQVSAVFDRVIPTGIRHGTVPVLLRGAPYEVTVLSQPQNWNQTCYLYSSATGTISGADALNITVNCYYNTFKIYVTVTGGGQRVLDLEREDFRITDEGKRQKIVTFERGDVPITATLPKSRKRLVPESREPDLNFFELPDGREAFDSLHQGRKAVPGYRRRGRARMDVGDH